MYGLPPCTTASGCLTIVNQMGQTSPMPAGDGQGCNGWAGETSLDVDMVSAACPNCKILVVLSNDDDIASMMPNLEMSQATAAMLGATVISDSWGGADSDTADIMKMNKYFDLSPHKTGIFIAVGRRRLEQLRRRRRADRPRLPEHVGVRHRRRWHEAQEVDDVGARLDRDGVGRRRQLVQPA